MKSSLLLIKYRSATSIYRDVKWSEIKDFTGKVIDPEKTGNGDITLYLERFEDDGKKRSSVDHDERQSLKK